MTDTTRIDERAELLVLAMVESGVFCIDLHGHVWRIADRKPRSGVLIPCEPRRAEYTASNGYLRIKVSVCGVRVDVAAHRIVYRHFHGPIPDAHVVDHRDMNPANNWPDNLEAVTVGENNRRVYSRGSRGVGSSRGGDAAMASSCEASPMRKVAMRP